MATSRSSANDDSNIWKKMGQRAFGGAGTSGKRTSSPTEATKPKRAATMPAATTPAAGSTNSLFQGHQQPTTRTTTWEPRVPVIYMDDTPTWQTHAAKMKELVEGDFLAVYRGKQYRVKTTTADHFRALQRYCFTEGVPFYTFQTGRGRALKVVISGLPTNTEQLELVDALLESGFEVMEAAKLRSARGVSRSWLVTLTPDIEREEETSKRASEIWKLTTLFHVKVVIAAYKRPAGPPQCHRCQGFGHGSSHCGRPYRCVRCGGPHQKTSCPKPNEEVCICCNCGGQHSANYKGCPAYKEARNKQRTTATKNKVVARKKQKEEGEPPFTQKRKASEPAEDEDDSSATESDEFQTVTRRRKRPPRNPANRSPPKSRAFQLMPDPKPRETPRRRINWPPKPIAAPAPAPTTPREEVAHQPQEPVPEAVATPMTSDHIATILAGFVQQLTALASAATELLAAFRQQ